MKNLFTLFVLFFGFGMQFLQAQTSAPLNKQQTVDYIEKLAKISYKHQSWTITNVGLNGKSLTITYSDGEIVRKDLQLPYPLKIAKKDCGYAVAFDTVEEKFIISCLQLEDDAKRLKKATEHLIEIFKTEKNTDPFGD